MKNRTWPIMILFLLLTLNSCKKETTDKDCIVYREAVVVSAKGPVNGQAGKDLIFQLEYGVSNGCSGFSKFEQQISNNKYKIKLIAADHNNCNFCTADAPILKTTYTFKADKPGNYTLIFNADSKWEIEDNVLIQ